MAAAVQGMGGPDRNSKTFDDLIEFLLIEFALCGSQGAGSADFRRVIHTFYQKPHRQLPPEGLGRRFYDTVWDWLHSHQDIRIVYNNEPHSLSLSEFEALELQETKGNGAKGSDQQPADSRSESHRREAQSEPALVSTRSCLANSLRLRLQAEGYSYGVDTTTRLISSVTVQNSTHSSKSPASLIHRHKTTPRPSTPVDQSAHHPIGSLDTEALSFVPADFQQLKDAGFSRRQLTGWKRGPRKVPKGVIMKRPTFDTPVGTTTAPRMYVSQNRTWLAIAGHSMDLARLPSMSFTLLSIISAHGANGILQPDLSRISGQDKRSVPGRTDRLAQAGYIEKKPVQVQKFRTSLCVHKRFLNEDHFLNGPGDINEVFRSRTLILSNFAKMLYNLLEGPKYALQRTLRVNMGVAVGAWNARAIRSAIGRLEESGMVERKRVLKKGSQADSVIIIKLLRPPNDEDVKNLSFRRKPTNQHSDERNLEDDQEGDDAMRDVDLDLNSDFEYEDEEDRGRIPPQWSPDQSSANLIYNAVKSSGADGLDNAELRDLTMGKFWKRPIESFIARLTDGWEQSQPLHLRHLAIIRDTAVTTEKRYTHYKYRTYANFQKAVDNGDVLWEAVSKEASKKASGEKRGRPKKSSDQPGLDEWGFPTVNLNDFHLRSGACSLTDCRAVSGGRRRAPHWDNALTQEMGYKKKRPNSKSGSILKPSFISLDQRKALGLSPRGRLPKDVVKRIQAHRAETGDPTSIPEQLVKDSNYPTKSSTTNEAATTETETVANNSQDSNRSLATKSSTGDFGKKHNLPRKGQLNQDIIDHHRLLDGLERETNGFLDVQATEQEGGNNVDIAEQDGSLVTEATPTKSVDPAGSLSTRPFSQTTVQSEAGGFVCSEPQPPDMAKRRLTDTARSQPYPKRPRTSRVSPTQNGDHDGNNNGVENMASYSAGPGYEHLFKNLDPSVTSSPQLEVDDDDPTLSQTNDTTSKTIYTRRKAPSAATQSREQEIVDAFTNRENQGLYINPFATRRPVGRGRPRKALMAIFKYEALKDLEWFKNNPSVMVEVTPEKQKNTPGRCRKQSSGAIDAPPGSPVLGSMHTLPPLSANEVLANSEHQERHLDSQKSKTRPVFAPTPANTKNENEMPRTKLGTRQESPIRTPQDGTSTLQPSTLSGALPPTVQSTSEAQSPVGKTSGAFDVSKTTPPLSPPPVIVEEETPAENEGTSKVITLPLGTEKETPVGDEDVSMTEPPPLRLENETHAGDDDAAENATPLPGTSVVTDDVKENLSLPNYSALGYQRKPRHEFHKKRGVVLGGGSVWRLRITIIWQILELCGGVFPYNGEIAGPFYTLWDQQAPKSMARPDRSTLISTMKNLMGDPAGRLKKITFRMPTLGGSLVDRFIVTTKDISPSDPRVIELRNNMIKSHPRRFFPEPVRHLIGSWDEDERIKRRTQLPQLVNIDLSELYPASENSLDARIQNSAQRRRKRTAKQAVKVSEIRSSQNAAAVKSVLKNDVNSNEGGRARRRRLDTLAAPIQPARTNVKPSRATNEPGDIGNAIAVSRQAQGDSGTDSDDDLPLIDRCATQSINLGSSNLRGISTTSATPTREKLVTQADAIRAALHSKKVSTGTGFIRKLQESISESMLNPDILFFAQSGVFSTDFSFVRAVGVDLWVDPIKAFIQADETSRARAKGNGAKRVRIEEPDTEKPRKKRRTRVQTTKYKKKTKGQSFDPTLLERLTGLTGDQNEIWRPERPVSRKRWTPQTSQRVRKPSIRKSVETSVVADKFKKAVCTLIIASCMSNEDDKVDWSIVTEAYSDDPRFNIQKTKDLWAWMQQNMRYQLTTLTSRFQSEFLEAYERRQVASIDDLETYDWAVLVRWALRTCEYPEPPLPMSSKVLQDYFVEELNAPPLDRPKFMAKNVSNNSRIQRLLKYSYAAPLYERPKRSHHSDEDIRARSWIRANTATPEGVYDADEAHNKFRLLGEPVLKRVVVDMMHEKSLRMRKTKRLLPGRNFNFPASLGPSYRRDLTPVTFIDAVQFKKSLDESFMSDDPSKRVVSVLRTAKDGDVMALLTLLADGQVKMTPRLPPVNNELRAPAPSISVWGFSQGDYARRGIDRTRLFWAIDIFPTSTYQFGSPLQPSTSPTLPPSQSTAWSQLSPPPLPGKHNPTALLPIWSSITGTHVTYPWWYRILNIILQAMLVQPRISVDEIHAHTSNNTIMVFEIDLVLAWLVDVNAAVRFPDRTYTLLNGFWAAFGEKLIDIEHDWFGVHVRATRQPDGNNSWKMKSHLEISLQGMKDSGTKGTGDGEDGPEKDGEDSGRVYELGESYLQRGVRSARPRVPFTEAQKRALHKGRETGPETDVVDNCAKKSVGEKSVDATEPADVQMVDVDTVGEEDPDIDAEGEDDDDFFETQMRE